MMSYDKFKHEIKKCIKDYLSDDFQEAEVFMQKMMRNNNVISDAIYIKRKEDTIMPQAHLEYYYSYYEETGSFTAAAAELADVLQDRQVSKMMFNDMNDLFDFEKVKDSVILQLVNIESNQEILERIPHERIRNTDLAVIFRIKVHAEEHRIGSVKATKEMLSCWNISTKSLYETALNNTEREYPFTFHSLEDIIFNNEKNDNENALPLKLDGYGAYILSTKLGINGAAAILYPDLLDKISRVYEGSYFIFPSSIHEVIIMKDNGIMDAHQLQQMVADINMMEVAPDDILSNQVFYYNAYEHLLSMLASNVKNSDIAAGLEYHFDDYDITQENQNEDLEM